MAYQVIQCQLKIMAQIIWQITSYIARQATLFSFGCRSWSILKANLNSTLTDVVGSAHKRLSGAVSTPKNWDLHFPTKMSTRPLFTGETKLQRAIRQAEGEMSHLFGNSYKEEDSSLRQMQAELIDFLGRQVMRKNRKIVTLTCHLAGSLIDLQQTCTILTPTQLCNLWWLRNSVTKSFENAKGSSRRFNTHTLWGNIPFTKGASIY